YVRRRLPGVSVAPPEATYLAWLDCRDAAIAGGDPFTFFLETARVALNDGTAFGRSGQGFVRLNFGCPRTILTEGRDRRCAALAGHGEREAADEELLCHRASPCHVFRAESTRPRGRQKRRTRGLVSPGPRLSRRARQRDCTPEPYREAADEGRPAPRRH